MSNLCAQRGLAVFAALAMGWSIPAAVTPERGENQPANTVQQKDLPEAVQKALLAMPEAVTVERIIKRPTYYVVELALEDGPSLFTVTGDATRFEGPARKPSGDKPSQDPDPKTTLIKWSEVPKAVQELVSTRFQGVLVGEVRRGLVTYAVNVKTARETGTIQITENGRIVPSRKERDSGMGGERESEARKARGNTTRSEQQGNRVKRELQDPQNEDR